MGEGMDGSSRKAALLARKVNGSLVGIALLAATWLIVAQLDPLLYARDKSEWYHRQAYTHFVINQNSDLPVSLVAKALGIDPNNDAARVTQSMIFVKGGEFKKAEDNIRMVLSHADAELEDDALFQLIKMRARQCNLNTAWNLSLLGLARFPEDEKFYLYIGGLLLHEGNSSAAESYLKQAMKLRSLEPHYPYEDPLITFLPEYYSWARSENARKPERIPARPGEVGRFVDWCGSAFTIREWTSGISQNISGQGMI
jgi:tetratricopeptide (TPR) repeat protein